MGNVLLLGLLKVSDENMYKSYFVKVYKTHGFARGN